MFYFVSKADLIGCHYGQQKCNLDIAGNRFVPLLRQVVFGVLHVLQDTEIGPVSNIEEAFELYFNPQINAVLESMRVAEKVDSFHAIFDPDEIGSGCVVLRVFVNHKDLRISLPYTVEYWIELKGAYGPGKP